MFDILQHFIHLQVKKKKKRKKYFLFFHLLGADSLGIEIENYVNITNTSNFVLVMKLSTKIQNFDNFFTDLNGFEVCKIYLFTKIYNLKM